jgi:hypothetical protein
MRCRLVLLLGLPPRPFSCRLPAVLAAISLACLPDKISAHILRAGAAAAGSSTCICLPCGTPSRGPDEGVKGSLSTTVTWRKCEAAAFAANSPAMLAPTTMACSRFGPNELIELESKTGCRRSSFYRMGRQSKWAQFKEVRILALEKSRRVSGNSIRQPGRTGLGRSQNIQSPEPSMRRPPDFLLASERGR